VTEKKKSGERRTKCQRYRDEGITTVRTLSLTEKCSRTGPGRKGGKKKENKGEEGKLARENIGREQEFQGLLKEVTQERERTCKELGGKLTWER